MRGNLLEFGKKKGMVLLVHPFFMGISPIVFFLYALSFYSMGLAILLEVRKATRLRIALILPLFAWFAIIHAVSEWLDMIPIFHQVSNVFALSVLRLLTLGISSLFLVFFGTELVGKLGNRKWVRLIPLPLVLAWLSLSFIFFGGDFGSFFANSRILMFYLFFFFGSLIAGWGFIIQYRELVNQTFRPFAYNFLVAAILLLILGTFEGFFTVPQSFYFPASVLNDQAFMSLTGVPAELIRAFLVLSLTIFIIRGLRIFESESEKRVAYLEEKRRLMDVLQESLLQFKMPAVDGLDIATHYESATTEAAIGGDFYDFFEIEDNKYLFAVGDVSGKGIEVAADAFRTSQAIRCLCQENAEPEQILGKANNIILKQTKAGSFATMTLFFFDKLADRLVYSSAGHPYPIFCDGQKCRFLTEAGAALGNFQDEIYSQEELTFTKGGAIVLYSDGLAEAKRNGELYSDERLMALVEKNHHLNAQELINKIIDEVTDFARGVLLDDIVIMVVKRLVNSEE